MASEIKAWQIVDGKLLLIETSLAGNGRKEKNDLELWIKSNSSVLGDDIVVIGEQVKTATGFIDFLGIDRSGNTVIIELKRDKLPRDVLTQAIDYASDVADWGLEKFSEICMSYTSQTLEDYFLKKFPDIAIEDLAINQAQRLLLVGFGVDSSLARMVEWLSDKYSIGINAVILKYIKTVKGEEILSRMVIIPEDIEKQKANRKKFIIEMADDPGTYDEQTLEKKLIDYLTNNLYSSQRIKNYLLPILLDKGQVTRDQLRKEFVRLNAAPDESQAGYFLSLISNQLGQKYKDYLRQIISYEYPKYTWEKDNFKIKKEYVQLVKNVLEKIRTNIA